MSRRGRWIIAIAVVDLALVIAIVIADAISGYAVTQFLLASPVPALPIALIVALTATLGVFVHHQSKSELEVSAQVGGRWSGDPVNLDTQDDFERTQFVEHLARILDLVGSNESSSTIGLGGPWGIGKTSVLDTLIKRLKHREANPNWIVAELNPWRYVSVDAMTLGFFAELRSALPEADRWDDARSAIGDLLQSAAPLGSLSALAGWDSSRVLGGLSRRIKGVDSASRTKRLAERSLARLERPVLVVVDDIDRLGPDELLNLFKLIRLLGRLPNVHYLLSFDEQTVADVLTRTGLVGIGHPEKAVRYLEKVVQVRIDLPPARQAQVEAVVDRVLDELMAQYGIPQSTASEFALTYQLHIGPRLSTPRALNRWLTHLELLYPALHGEIDFFDFAVFTWLRLTYPSLFQLLQSRKREIFPASTMLSVLTSSGGGPSLEDWIQWLTETTGTREDAEAAFAVLLKLFPTLDRVGSTTKSAPNLDDARRRKGIGHPDYFERYFFLGVPAEEVSEVTFAEELRSIVATGSDSGRLAWAIRQGSASILLRIEEFVADQPSLAAQFVVWVARNYDNANDVDLLSAKSAIRSFIFRVVRQSQAPLEILSQLRQVNLFLAGRATVDLLRERALSEDAMEAVRTQVETWIVERLHELEGPFETRPAEYWQLAWLWQPLDNPSLRRWYRRQATLHGLLDALAGLVSSGHVVGVPEAVTTLGDLSDTTIEGFLGIEWLVPKLRKTPPQDGPRLKGGDWDRPEATWENRLAIARDTVDRLLGREATY